MRIGVDLDGVCYHWERTARYLLRERLPNSPYTQDGPLGKVSDSWDYIPRHVAAAHWKWLWNEGVKQGLFRHGHVIKGAIEGLQELTRDGHEVIIITHRPKQAVNDTLAWLAFANLDLCGVHILTSQEDKSGVRPYCDVYVDDKIENVVDYANATPAKLVALFDQPWNATFATYGAIERVHGWKEFVARVKGLA